VYAQHTKKNFMRMLSIIILKKPKIILKNELSLWWASSKNISNTKHTHKK
jgi:hypothetical protein